MNRQAPVGTAQKRCPVSTSTRVRASFPSLVPIGTSSPDRVVDSSGALPTLQPAMTLYPLSEIIGKSVAIIRL